MKSKNAKKIAVEFTTLMVAPPNAQLIVDKIKDVENRTRGCNIRGYVALYSSCSRLKWRFDYWKDKGYKYDPDQIDYGKILGFVEIVELIEPGKRKGYKGAFHERGYYGIWVKNIIKLKKPVPTRFPNGTINWGKLKGKKLEACMKQLSNAQKKKLKIA